MDVAPGVTAPKAIALHRNIETISLCVQRSIIRLGYAQPTAQGEKRFPQGFERDMDAISML